MIPYRLPTHAELKKAGREERMNAFRRYFASSRYNRFIIQQALVRLIITSSLKGESMVQPANNTAGACQVCPR
ncbi:MAG: hypothetical protein C4292_05135 [Nitrososphaera sp.]